MVTKHAPMQSAELTLRKEMNEQGSGDPNDVADKKEGAAAGFNRVYDGFLFQQSQFRRIPGAARAEGRAKRD